MKANKIEASKTVVNNWQSIGTAAVTEYDDPNSNWNAVHAIIAWRVFKALCAIHKVELPKEEKALKAFIVDFKSLILKANNASAARQHFKEKKGGDAEERLDEAAPQE